MLPFTTPDFFILSAIMLGVVLLGKLISKYFVSYRILLFILTLVYISFFFPRPLHAFVFVTYSYLIYFIFEYVFKLKQKLIGALLLVLPMILVKSAFHTDLIAFAGLSYITFRTIQVYLDNKASEKPANIIDFILFMLFPATLLIGPIDRFQRFKNDLNGGYARLNGKQLVEGWQMLLLGIVQKFILAEFVNRYWLEPLHADSKATGDVLNNMYAYSFFLYFDFAGYSSMAAGLGRLFGIDVPENFNNPFFAINPQDFWRRWHATLGDWLREYIFRPYYKWISGKKRLKNFPLFKQNSGLFLIFVIMGLWNGFRGNFILSGMLFGLYSVVHNSYVYFCRKKGKDIVFGKLSEKTIHWISIVIMFNLTCIALYIFSGRCPFL